MSELQKIRIVHCFPDDKFFDGVSDFFDVLPNVENIYPYYDKTGKFDLKLIKKKDKITFFESIDDYYALFSSPEVDVVYLHGLKDYGLFKYIDRSKIVIWWSWGFDIYSQPFPFCPPVVKLKVLKPLTNRWQNSHISFREKTIRLIKTPAYLWLYYKFLKTRNEVLNRIDYYTPVLPIEWDLINKNKHFRAKPFCIELGPGPGKFLLKDLKVHTEASNILIGNSYTPSNNHFDIFNIIKEFDISGRKWIIPINYGSGYNSSKEEFISKSGLKAENAIWLEEFMPYQEYISLFANVSHAMFGFIRQQGMGNVSACMKAGVKIYLFKDSVVYKYLRDKGYVVFSIEDELTEESLSIPLSEEDAVHNMKLLQIRAGNNYDRYTKAFQEIAIHRNKL